MDWNQGRNSSSLFNPSLLIYILLQDTSRFYTIIISTLYSSEVHITPGLQYLLFLSLLLFMGVFRGFQIQIPQMIPSPRYKLKNAYKYAHNQCKTSPKA